MLNMRNKAVAEVARAFYSPAGLARVLGVHPDTILNYIHAERIFAIKLSERTYRIPAREVQRLTAPESLRPSRTTQRAGGGKRAAAAFRRRGLEERPKASA